MNGFRRVWGQPAMKLLPAFLITIAVYAIKFTTVNMDNLLT